LTDGEMIHRKTVVRGEDLGDRAKMAIVPVRLLAQEAVGRGRGDHKLPSRLYFSWNIRRSGNIIEADLDGD
jgi:hypothetical protein